VSGGGSPTGSPPPPAPRERTPAPPAEPVRASEPPRVPETRAEPVPEPKPARRPQIQVSRNRIRAGSTTAPANDTRTETARELRNQVSAALRDVRNSLSSSTSIELRGPGGGGVPYANWLAAVKKAYTDAWLPPEGIQDDSATATVSITIARDGTVVDWRFVKRSGNAVVDSSIESAVKRVRPAPKLPAEAKEDQRTVIIDFNLKVKQLLG
ncbi:MAG TPA: TonB family protein, partial [Verrucomicrobiota bacterium]|nr:TonB family protein [Verrucomicrobiota bacterium]